MIFRHIHVWRKLTDRTDDDVNKQYLLAQVKRRCLTSAGIATLGLIFASFSLVTEPIAFTILAIATFIITFLVLMLAGLEFVAASHMISRERQLSTKAKQELLREHDRLKQKIKNAESVDNQSDL